MQQEWGWCLLRYVITDLLKLCKGHFVGPYEKLMDLNLIKKREYLTLRSFSGCIGSNSIRIPVSDLGFF